MEIFLIVLAAIAGTGVAFFLFVIEPSTIAKVSDGDAKPSKPPPSAIITNAGTTSGPTTVCIGTLYHGLLAIVATDSNTMDVYNVPKCLPAVRRSQLALAASSGTSKLRNSSPASAWLFISSPMARAIHRRVAAVLDAWSRRVIGYAISRSIDARVAVAALKAALRGNVLADNGLVGSMGRRGNPYDNAKAESFMKTVRQPPQSCIHHSDRGSQYASEIYRLKVEAVYLTDYQTFEDGHRRPSTLYR